MKQVAQDLRYYRKKKNSTISLKISSYRHKYLTSVAHQVVTKKMEVTFKGEFIFINSQVVFTLSHFLCHLETIKEKAVSL